MRRVPLLLAAATMLAVCAAPAGAGVPSPSNSSFTCVRACPGYDLPTYVTVRDIAGNPVALSTVVLDFSQCPGYAQCPWPTWLAPWDDYLWDPVTRTVRIRAFADGVARIFLRGGGIGGAGSVRLYADGVFLGASSLFSPDQNGDLVFDNTDYQVFLAKLGTTDPTGDLDCDGLVTEEDRRRILWDSSHQCVIPTPANTSTWGRLKVLYR